MNNYQKALIEEHSALIVRTQDLHDYLYSEKSNNEDKIEFANKAIQLSAMKKYEECLRARLINANVIFEDGQYFEKVASITPAVVVAETSSTTSPVEETVEQTKPSNE